MKKTIILTSLNMFLDIPEFKYGTSSLRLCFTTLFFFEKNLEFGRVEIVKRLTLTRMQSNPVFNQ